MVRVNFQNFKICGALSACEVKSSAAQFVAKAHFRQSFCKLLSSTQETMKDSYKGASMKDVPSKSGLFYPLPQKVTSFMDSPWTYGQPHDFARKLKSVVSYEYN